MKQMNSHAFARRSLTALTILVVAASAVGAQSAQLGGTAASFISVSDPSANSWNNAQYAADRNAGSNFSGVVNLWFRDGGGNVIHGCTGSHLGGGKILTAAHCVSNGANNIASSFTARFYQNGTGWVDVHGTGMVAKPGYSGNVLEENDVAVLTLGSAAPAFARRYALASGTVLGNQQYFAGYGRTGNGLVGASVPNNQFNDNAFLRFGKQVFETTCNTAGFCATVVNASPGNFGGILMADFDRSGVSSGGLVCTSLGFCGVGFGGFEEVTTGPGDSGGASFNSDWTISGVASFGAVTQQGIGGFFGFYAGHACVADIDTNIACDSNNTWVTSQVVPEPGTVALTAAGLLALFGAARRRRLV